MEAGLQQTSLAVGEADIPRIFAAYLRGPAAARNELVHLHPTLFTAETVAALATAVAQLSDIHAEAGEVVSVMEGVRAELDLPDGEASLAPLQPDERRQLEDPEAILELFAANLATLLAETQPQERQPAAPPADAVGDTLSGEGQQVDDGEQSTVALWHQTAPLMLTVLSYLTVEEVLTIAEDVCRAWRYWLYQPEFSKYFWIEAVQREFPVELGLLIQTQGSDIMHSDWRSIAMLMCAEDEGDDDSSEVVR